MPLMKKLLLFRFIRSGVSKTTLYYNGQSTETIRKISMGLLYFNLE